MFQALVKTTPTMLGSYTFAFGSPEERAEFVKRADIWWYFFPEQDEHFFGGAVRGLPSWDSPQSSQRGWKKGRAWKPVEVAESPEPDSGADRPRW